VSQEALRNTAIGQLLFLRELEVEFEAETTTRIAHCARTKAVSTSEVDRSAPQRMTTPQNSTDDGCVARWPGLWNRFIRKSAVTDGVGRNRRCVNKVRWRRSGTQR
jgi:hypothetical protein